MFHFPVIIGGREVGNWEGDQPISAGEGGVVFYPQGGGDKFRLSEGGNGGEDKRQNRKMFLIAAERQHNFGNLEEK